MGLVDEELSIRLICSNQQRARETVRTSQPLSREHLAVRSSLNITADGTDNDSSRPSYTLSQRFDPAESQSKDHELSRRFDPTVHCIRCGFGGLALHERPSQRCPQGHLTLEPEYSTKVGMAPQKAQMEDPKLGTSAGNNGDGNGSKEDGAKGKQGPRKRVSQACDKCRSRKDKCDGKKPVRMFSNCGVFEPLFVEGGCNAYHAAYC